MGKKQTATEDRYRSRIREFVPSYPTSQLIEHPENWRVHPETQKRLLSSLMARHGKIDAILCYDSQKYGGRVIIDGHQRSGMDESFPVLVLDVTDEEAKEILLTYNPLAEMAEANQDQVEALASQISGLAAEERKAVDEILSTVLKTSVAQESDVGRTQLDKIEVKAPPRMIWTVIGVPVHEYGTVAAAVESLSAITGAIVETTASDFNPEKGK